MLTLDEYGPAAWTYLHIVTHGYPEDPTVAQKEDYRNFFRLVGKTFPCPVCAVHFEELLRRMPPDLRSKKTLVTWMYRIHNEVRKSQGKAPVPLDQCDAMLKRSGRVAMTRTQGRWVLGLIVTLIVLALLILGGGVAISIRHNTTT